MSKKGQETWIGTRSERKFHEALREYLTRGLQILIDTIFVYETFARLLQDAFDDCLMLMTRKSGTKIKAGELAESERVVEAASRIPAIFNGAYENLQGVGESKKFYDIFSKFEERVNISDWVERLLQHHEEIQKRKPPEGKSPWFVRTDDGSILVRPAYCRDKGGVGDSSAYVHYYRTNPLWSFMFDLRLVGTNGEEG